MKCINAFLVLGAAFLPAIVSTHVWGDTTHITPDSTRQAAGYQVYDLTTFRDGRLLIEAVKGSSDRSNKMIMETTQSSVSFDLTTSCDRAEVVIQYISSSTAVVNIDGQQALEVTQTSPGNWVLTGWNFGNYPWTSLKLFADLLADSSLSSSLPGLPPFAPVVTLILTQVQPGAACYTAHCAGPGITTNQQCVDCCVTYCSGANATYVGCVNSCNTIFPTTPPPPPSGGGCGVPHVVLTFLMACVATSFLVRRRLGIAH